VALQNQLRDIEATHVINGSFVGIVGEGISVPRKFPFLKI
jgi:hypothetical protein